MDGFEWNEGRDGIPYITLHDKPLPDSKSEHGGFDARIDSTDHATFYCIECKLEVAITRARLYRYNEDANEHGEKLLCLYFELACKRCKRTDSKKIYVNGHPLGTDWK